MNEELKIIIKAITDNAKKGIKDVSKELNGLSKNGSSTSKSFGTSMKAMGKVSMVAAGAVATAVAAVGAALVKLSQNTMEFREEQAKLQASFQAQGHSAQTASKIYKELYGVIGEMDTAVEAAQQIALFAKSEEEAAKWAELGAGVIGTFGDALKPETFYEAVNETLSLGEATGAYVQMLEGAHQNVDEFNAKLQSLTTMEERRNFILETSNRLMGEAGDRYREQMADIIAYRDSQTNLNIAMAEAGKAAQPLSTALNNLGASVFNALTPAINAVIPYIVSFIDAISKAVGWVVKFFNVLSGNKSAPVAVASGMSSAATGAKNLQKNTEGATKAAEKLKRSTAGFDELNVMSNNAASAGSGAGGGGGISAGGGLVDTGGVIDTSGLDTSLDESTKKIETFIETIKGKIDQLKDVFSPTIEAWSGAFDTVATAWDGSKGNFLDGIINIRDSFLNLGTYVGTDFVPTIINSFSENLAPMFGDVFGFGISETSLAFESISGIVKDHVDNQIIPNLETLKTNATDIFSSIGTAWDKHGTNLLTQISGVIESIRTSIENFYYGVIDPIMTLIREKWDEVWTNSLKPLVDEVIDAVLDIATNILLLYNKYVAPVVDWLEQKIYPIIVKVVGWIVDSVGDAIDSIAGVIKGIIKTIKGIVQFITGVFTGDWKKAWEGVKNIFKGIFDTLYNVVKAPLNLIIGAINGVLKGITTAVNTAIRAINKLSFTVPDWVPGIGGSKFGFNIKEVSAPQIPKLATGGIAIGETLARIGEGGRKEAVLPLEQNTQWMDMLADRINARNNAPTKIVLSVDGKELGWASINGINSITQQTGNLQLALV
jgi:phage-related protein